MKQGIENLNDELNQPLVGMKDLLALENGKGQGDAEKLSFSWNVLKPSKYKLDSLSKHQETVCVVFH